MRITVDQDRCVSAGHCVVSAPDVFDQREEDGVVVLLDPRPPVASHAGVSEAALLCPAAVIRVARAVS
ncbi:MULTISPECIES: ferredoxin [unclassified Streptomyces]|uniref:ferredoxin n=1 Tax=unclassified Streptomyces TaxID=2593676 RepID=UPI002961ED14|nr:ferredoxin [Streptomyces sp. N50]WOX15954.1 ferredoxin [Streptomyces sp. N50]